MRSVDKRNSDTCFNEFIRIISAALSVIIEAITATIALRYSIICIMLLIPISIIIFLTTSLSNFLKNALVADVIR
jgi:hypothetical protein